MQFLHPEDTPNLALEQMIGDEIDSTSRSCQQNETPHKGLQETPRHHCRDEKDEEHECVRSQTVQAAQDIQSQQGRHEREKGENQNGYTQGRGRPFPFPGRDTVAEPSKKTEKNSPLSEGY